MSFFDVTCIKLNRYSILKSTPYSPVVVMAQFEEERHMWLTFTITPSHVLRVRVSAF